MDDEPEVQMGGAGIASFRNRAGERGKEDGPAQEDGDERAADHGFGDRAAVPDNRPPPSAQRRIKILQQRDAEMAQLPRQQQEKHSRAKERPRAADRVMNDRSGSGSLRVQNI